MNHDDAFFADRDIDCSANSVLAPHPHLPQLAFEVFDVRLPHCEQAVALNQLDGVCEALPDIRGKLVELKLNPSVQYLHVPGHMLKLISKTRCRPPLPEREIRGTLAIAPLGSHQNTRIRSPHSVFPYIRARGAETNPIR